MSVLSQMSLASLVEEILRRPEVVASIWSGEDAVSVVSEDDTLPEMAEEQLQEIAAAFVVKAGEGLRDALGQRGNDYLADIWPLHRDEILEEVLGAPTP